MYARQLLLGLHKRQTLGHELLQNQTATSVDLLTHSYSSSSVAHTSNLAQTSSTRSAKGLFGSLAASLVSITFAIFVAH